MPRKSFNSACGQNTQDSDLLEENFDYSQNILLAESAAHNDIQTALELLKNKVDPNFPDSNGWMPIHYAAAHGHLKMTELLLNFGANPNLCNCDGQLPDALAARYGYKDIKTLIRNAQKTSRRKVA